MNRFIISALLVFVSALVFGQASASLESEELLMGNTLKLSIRVPMPSDTASVEFPLLQEARLQKRKYVGLLNDTIEILADYKRALETDGSKVAMRYDLTVQAFDSGRYVLPPFEFLVNRQLVSSNPVELSVLPVKVKADDKIDDFVGPASPFELNPNPDEGENRTDRLVWWIAAGVILAVLVLLTFLYYRKNGKSFLPSSKPKTPYEQAIEKLEKLKKQNLPERGRTKEYYTHLTDIVRVYLNRQFGVKTFEKTSAEILDQIEAKDDLESYYGVLKSIFEISDFVKFAKVQPTVEENRRCLEDAERFVEVSHPVENADKETKGGES